MRYARFNSEIIQGNCAALDGVPCFTCHKTDGMDRENRYDCESNSGELSTYHKGKCYKVQLKGRFFLGNPFLRVEKVKTKIDQENILTEEV